MSPLPSPTAAGSAISLAVPARQASHDAAGPGPLCRGLPVIADGAPQEQGHINNQSSNMLGSTHRLDNNFAIFPKPSLPTNHI